MAPTHCASPTHSTTPLTDQTPPRSDPSLHAWVEQLDAQQPCLHEPMPSYKALRPGYPQSTYPYDPTLSEIINDGTVQQVQGGSIVVYTTAFNRPPDYMLLSLIHFMCMNPITGSVAIFLSGTVGHICRRVDPLDVYSINVRKPCNYV